MSTDEYAPDLCPACRQDYLDEDGECDYCLGVYDDPEDDGQPSFMDEHDSSMTSACWARGSGLRLLWWRR